MLDDDAYLRWSRSRDSPILLAPSLSIFPRPPARRVANSPLRVYENRNAVLASLADMVADIVAGEQQRALIGSNRSQVNRLLQTERSEEAPVQGRANRSVILLEILLK